MSGSVPLRERQGEQELLRFVKLHKVTNIIVFKLDRLFRDAEDALRQTREWDKSEIAFHLVDMGGQTVNTSSAMGRLFLTMMAGFAELERNLTGKRTATALSYKKAHRVEYFPTPYDYDREGNQLTQNSDELDIIKQVKEWHDSGWSLHRIAAEFNQKEVPTKHGGRWYAGIVRYMLKNSLYLEVA